VLRQHERHFGRPPIVITMLADGPAAEQAAAGPDGFLAAGPGLIS